MPDGVARSAGDVLVYYVNGAPGYTWVGQIADGSTPAPIRSIAINGVANPAGVVDPDALRMPGGRIRLTYLSGFGSPSSANARAICLADSVDGVRFTVYDTLTFGGVPEITALADGRVRL